MARAFTPKVLTANRLLEGDVIYYSANGDWVTSHDDALYLTDEVQANELLAACSKLSEYLVGAYLANAALEDGKPVPTHFREEFRTRGPSNYHHGKQAEV
ncbi:DUF2849 domain-containing protein [Amylibacter sp. SFDW26]|uniref:DUF2849 domain-containing protein n=1 Tax=Amylibacter sp. SFDW26 TaxID=2652722 RepID=UPI0012621D2C|nr:DUF2849 domain-containing protein [Amylibacter sp. SFDW26]KAB7615801.1 DUF2849 domain-containing protein [Amylibacter sp. SFDW26]